MAHLSDLEGGAQGDRAAAIFRIAGERVSVLQLEAKDLEAAVEVLAWVRFRGAALSFLNVLEGHVASSALRELGGNVDVSQLELAVSGTA